MRTLAPVDFKAAVSRGCVVYCYLRAKDSKTAKAGSPYYIGIAENATRPLMRHTRGTGGSRFHDVPVPKDEALIRLMGVFPTRNEALARETKLIQHYGRKHLDPGGILLNRSVYGSGGGHIRLSSPRRMGISAAAWASATKRERVRAWERFERGVRGQCDLLAPIQNLYEEMGFSQELWQSLDRPAQMRAYARFRRGETALTQLLAPCCAEEERLSASHQFCYERAAKRYGVSVEFWISLTPLEKKNADQRYSRGVRGPEVFSNVSLKKINSYAAAAAHGLTHEEWDALSRSQKTVRRRQVANASKIGVPLPVYMSMSPGERMVAARNGLNAMSA